MGCSVDMFVKRLLPVTLSKRWLYCGLKPHHPRRMQRHQHPEAVSLKSSIGRPPFSCWSWPGVMPRFDLAREGVSSNCTNSPPREIFGKTGRDGGVRRGQGWSSAPGGLVEWSGAGVGVGLLRLVDKTFPFPKLSLLACIYFAPWTSTLRPALRSRNGCKRNVGVMSPAKKTSCGFCDPRVRAFFPGCVTTTIVERSTLPNSLPQQRGLIRLPTCSSLSVQPTTTCRRRPSFR